MPPVPIFSRMRNSPFKMSRPMNGSGAAMGLRGLTRPPSVSPATAAVQGGVCENDGPCRDDRKMTVEFLESPLLVRAGFRHAFFTRRGGRSPVPYASLHFGATGQSAEDLAANVAAAASALGVATSGLYSATQVHGKDTVVVRAGDDRREVLARKADAVASAAPAVACGVKIADCVPVLIGDRATGAVAAIHSGWQGTEVNVVAAAIAAVRGFLGAPGDLVAAIGPHIETGCFEVGPDVAERLQSCAP